VWDRLSLAARRAMDEARRTAEALHHDTVGTAHVLVAMASDPATAAALALARQGAGPDRLRSKLQELEPGGPRRGAGKRTEDASFALDLREAAGLALEEAEVDDRFDIAPVHIFLAVTADDDFGAVALLRACGVDVERARREVQGLARDELQGSLPRE